MVSLRSRLLCWFLTIYFKRVWRTGFGVEDIRKKVRGLEALCPKPPRGTTICTENADGVPCEWINATAADSDRVLFYLHGGGFSLRLPALHRRLVADLSSRLNAKVLLVDYRLSPEHPFPAGPDDCLASYRWLLKQPGVDPKRVVIAGDSAGGNLTLVTLLLIKQAQLPQPAAAWTMSPGVDCDWSIETLEALQKLDPMTSTQALELMTPYFGDADRRDFRISPINGDLAGLPPLLIEAGEREMLREHPGQFAERARSAGVDVVDRVWPGMPHVFQAFGFLPEAKVARQQACSFLEGHMSEVTLNN
jgi:epsilon-lactone hydrolase